MSTEAEIIVVSGLPRTGTSLMMQMLEGGGIEVVTDRLRTADIDNPRGYYEHEAVKSIKQDASWLPQTRGKAFKMISLLLYDLPPTERYRIIFMERDMEEVLLSQETMLRRLNRTAAPRAQMQNSYKLHLERLAQWLRGQPNMVVLKVNYNDLVDKPEQQARRVVEFLGGTMNIAGMTNAVDPTLSRNRNRSTPL